MDKREQRKIRAIYFLLILGIASSLALIALKHGGVAWLGKVSWADFSWLQWIAMLLLIVIGIVGQYLFLLLLRYRFLKYLILVGIPALWLFNNGIIAISRFLDWTTDIGATIGWLSIADLLSWLAGAVYFPILVSMGAVSAILDANASMLSSACYYARMALDIANVNPWQIIDFSMNVIGILWDLLANSFTQEVIKATSDTDSLFEFSMAAALSLPQWMMTLGYSLACLCL